MKTWGSWKKTIFNSDEEKGEQVKELIEPNKKKKKTN